MTPADTEKALIGAMLQAPDFAIPAAVEIVGSEDFAGPLPAIAFDLLRQMANAGENIDAVTFTDRLLHRASDLDMSIVAGFSTECMTACPAPNHVRQYARTVRSRSQRRRFLADLDAAGKKVMEGVETDADFRGIVEDLMVRLTAVQGMTMHSHRGLADGHTVAQQVVETMVARYGHRGQPLGLCTGFADLDRVINGLQRGHLCVVAARPAMGKTALSTAVAEHVALGAANRRNRPVLMFTLEMAAEEIMERSLLGRARLALTKGRTGMFSQAEGAVWLAAKEVLPKMKGRPPEEVGPELLDAAIVKLEAYWRRKGRLEPKAERPVTRGEIEDAQTAMRHLITAITAVSCGNLTFYDGYGVTTQEVRTQVRNWVRSIGWTPADPDHCPPLVIIDYLQLVKASEKKAKAEPRLAIMEVCETLKGLAKELGIVVMPLAQLGRGTADNPGARPTLKDLKESGAIEEYADYVIALHRESYYKKWDYLKEDDKEKWEEEASMRNRHPQAKMMGEPEWDGRTYYESLALLMILKGRHSATADIRVTFQGEFARFTSKTPALYSNNAAARQQYDSKPEQDSMDF